MPGFPRVLEAVARGLSRTARRGARASGSSSSSASRQRERVRAPAASSLDPARARRGAASGSARLRRPLRRHRPGAEVPAADGVRLLPPLLAPAQRAATRSRDGAAHPDAHGARRHLRPARRRLPPLLGRRSAGWCRTSRRCSTTTPSSSRSTCTAWQATGDPVPPRRPRRRSTTSSARCAPGRRLLLDPGRGQRGRGGQVLRLGPGRGRVLARSPRPPALPSATGTCRRPQLRGPEHPPCPARARRGRGGARPDDRAGVRAPRAARATLFAASRATRQARHGTRRSCPAGTA